MKTIFFLVTICLSTFFSKGQPLPPEKLPEAMPIPSFRIGICTGKTTNLVFTYDIISVDRGTQNLLVQKVKNAENILQIKAAVAGLQETNLSVVTADKKLHSFIIYYDAAPPVLNFRFLKEVNDSGAIHTEPLLNKENLTEAQIEDYSALVADFEPSHTRIRDKKWGITFRLGGIFIKEDVIFFSLLLQNRSPVRYDIESLSMMIKDQWQRKRTASQELQVQPLYTYGNDSRIESGADQKLVVAVAKFTIPNRKDFIIQLREANGGRHLGFHIPNKKLMKARSL